MALHPELYQRMITAKRFMDENFHSGCPLQAVAEEACLSPFHFHRLFSQVYLQTPHRYLTSKRMEKAKQLLADNLPVSQVCLEVGYESLGTFSRTFKKETGAAPTYYRNIAWLKKQNIKEEPKSGIPHCFIQQYGW